MGDMRRYGLLGITYFTIICVTEATECLKNDDIGWRSGNMYSCLDPELPECCEINREFTCCEYPHVKRLREQLQMWGAVLLFIVTISIIYVYLKKDIQIFTRQTFQESMDNFKTIFYEKKDAIKTTKKHHKGVVNL